MFSIFSNSNLKKPSEIIIEASKLGGAQYERTLLSGPEDEPLYMLQPDIIGWLMWVNRKILYELPKLDSRTIDVRIRIATSMLNKLVDKGSIPKNIAVTYHKRLTYRTRIILSAIWTEDLPF